MSNFGEYSIISFENDISKIKENLEISLNLIFFHRYLGSNKYEDAYSILNHISYVKLINKDLSNEINNIIEKVEKNFTNNNDLYGQQLTLSFYEKGKNENPWEIWSFILVLSKKEESKDIKDLDIEQREEKIRDYVIKLIEKLNDKNNYMPNVKINNDNPDEETFTHKFKIDDIFKKEDYLSLFNNYMKKDQNNVIVVNYLP